MTPRIAVAAALVLLALTGCASNSDTIATDATIAAQAAEIANLTEENASIQARLDTCLATAAEYRGYIEDNKALMQGIIDKWGQNYNTPTKDAIKALDSATAQFKCD